LVIKKKFIMMHGHMNVKLTTYPLGRVTENQCWVRDTETSHNPVLMHCKTQKLWLLLQGCWQVLSPIRKETSYSDRRFWFSYILFI